MEGILPLFKPKGMTSHDCVFKVRKILHMKKVGHTGTLDPDVTGVLPICLGRATKVAEYLTDAGKTYEGEVTIGYATTTEDRSGEIIDEKIVDRVISRKEILDVFASLTGEIEQTPPMYSAVKVNGKKLYEYARKGIEVERPTRKVTIYELHLLSEQEQYSGDTISFRFRASCSKGTYIRTLAVMIGQKLGYPSHMSYLTRTASGGINVEQCITLEDLQEKMENGTVNDSLLPLETGISHLPKYTISDKVAEKVKNGSLLPDTIISSSLSEDPVALFNQNGQVIAIYQQHPTKIGLLKPVKVLRNDS